MEPANHLKKTVLVVDDEVDLCDIFKMDLEEAGYRVLVADSGSSGVKLLTHEKVDVIISDVRMPNGSGLELLDFVTSEKNQKPGVIFVTGFSDVDLRELYSRGAGGVVSKPWELQELLEKVAFLAEDPKLRYREKNLNDSKKKIVLEIKLESADFSEAIRKGRLSLGCGGAFIPLERDFPQIGDFISFSFGTGWVRWTRDEKTEEGPAGLGLEFFEIEERQMNDFNSLRSSLKTSAYIPLR